jgi:predicted kinase
VSETQCDRSSSGQFYGVIMLVGGPYCGKSAIAEQFPTTQVISLDVARAMVCDDPSDQSVTAEAVALAHHWLAARCRHHRPSVFDATNLRAEHRSSVLAIARRFRVAVHALIFDVPAETCLDRRRGRSRSVPEPIVVSYARDAARLVTAPDVLVAEGFTSVKVFRPEDGQLPCGSSPELLTAVTGFRDIHADAGELDATLTADDQLESLGMHSDLRRTCWTCQSWADHEHEQTTGSRIPATD